MDGICFEVVGSDDAIWMETKFEESYVLELLQAFNGEKAPGLDGFSFALCIFPSFSS